MNILLLGLFFIVIAWIGFWIWQKDALPFLSPAPTETPQGAASTMPVPSEKSNTPTPPAVYRTLTPTATIPPTSIPTIQPSPTTRAAPSATFTPIPRNDFGIPFGSEEKYVIHQVRTGESLSEYIGKYNTSVDAIKWINVDLAIPLMVDKLVIIPLDSRSLDPELPQFEAYQVSDDSIPVENLGLRLGVDIQDFLYFNGLNPNQVLPAGYWLIIPRQRK